MLTKHQKAGRRISSESLSNLSICQSKIISFSLELWQRSLRTARTSMKSLDITFVDTGMLIFYIIFSLFLLCERSFTPSFEKKKKRLKKFLKVDFPDD